jgi:hypothetical protein
MDSKYELHTTGILSWSTTNESLSRQPDGRLLFGGTGIAIRLSRCIRMAERNNLLCSWDTIRALPDAVWSDS